MTVRRRRCVGLTIALVFGMSVATGCDAVADSSASEATSEQYNEVRWASTLGDDGEVDVAVRELLFPPGWSAPRHFHNSDLFIYVLDGEFEVAMAGAAPVTYAGGQALEMRAEAEMTAHNVSETQPLKLVVFQVGQTQAPFVVPVQDPVP